MRVDWSGVAVLVALVAGGLVALALGKSDVATMLISAGVGSLAPGAVRKQ